MGQIRAAGTIGGFPRLHRAAVGRGGTFAVAPFTTKPAGEGAGLGLSLSHDIIAKQHNGSIAVESREGAFTEFTVSIPRGTSGDTP